MPAENLSIDELSERWDQLVVRARRVDWGSTELGNLGKKCGIPWFDNRSRELVADYLGYDAKRLVLIHGFGRIKIARLCDILTAFLDRVNPYEDTQGYLVGESGISSELIPPAPAEPDPRETLNEWSVPESFPCRLARFSNRLQNFLESQGVTTIGEALVMWGRQGRSGLIQQKNLGKKTVDELGELVLALQTADRHAVSRVIPLTADGEGISLAGAVRIVAGKLTSFEADLLHQRLVLGKTLEESAEGTGLTRERVRQVEAKLLASLRERLEYFAESYSELVDLWFRREDWFECVRPTEHGAVVEAGFEAIFNDLPQAVARRLNEENERETLLVELRSHPEFWFGGVAINDFITARVPEIRRAAVCEFLGSSAEFRIDHATGTLHPRKTGLFRATVAILLLEDNPVPATWLIKLLRSTGFHSTISREDLTRRKWRWERTSGFPARKILWDE
jgi:hypothetical protein